MSEFKKYRRTGIVEMRPLNEEDIKSYRENSCELIVTNDNEPINVLIFVEDLAIGSPKIGDMIVRNPQNYDDMWLISEEYFRNNFELISDKQ